MKFVDRQGRVDKFQQKVKAAQAKQAQLQAKKAKKKSDSQEDPKSYRELLLAQQRTLRQVAKSRATAIKPN